jgi:hypothetical protein
MVFQSLVLFSFSWHPGSNAVGELEPGFLGRAEGRAIMVQRDLVRQLNRDAFVIGSAQENDESMKSLECITERTVDSAIIGWHFQRT